MGFRKPEDKDLNRPINAIEFGIGSCITVSKFHAFLLSATPDHDMLLLTDLKTFKTYTLNTKVESKYHITSEESYDISKEVNGILNEGNARSDYGWNSKGIKGLSVEYEDN